jgi:hypothetical protein
MTTKRFSRVLIVALATGSLPLAAFADEIVHFTNGAEMTVRSHVLENEKKMVKLDLGGNSFISFPMSMVDKIVNAGHDVFLNPVFHPANQAIAGSPGSGGTAPTETAMKAGGPAGYVRRPPGNGNALGETAEAPPIPGKVQSIDQSVANSRRVFNPAFQNPPGTTPQVILPHGAPKTPVSFAMNPLKPPAQTPPPAPPAPPANNDANDNPPPGDPAPEDPPDTP